MPFDFIGFIKDIDFKKTDNVIGDILKESVHSLDRGRGAVVGALSHYPNYGDIFTDPKKFAEDYSSMYAGAFEGFKRPEEQNPIEDIGAFKPLQNLPDPLRKGAEFGLDVGLDPLSYLGVGLIGKGTKLGPIGEMLFSPVVGRNASLGKRVTGELATNLGARVGSEVGGELAEGTPLETPASIIGGLAGGIGSARAVSRSVPNVIKPTYSSMVEEQLEDGNIFDYLDSLDKTPKTMYQVYDQYTDTYRVFDTIEEATDFSKGGFNLYSPQPLTQPSDYDEAINQLYNPEMSKEIEIFNNLDTTTPQKYIRPNMNIIPLDYALKDDALDSSHLKFTTRFHSFAGINSDVDRMLGNWISTIGGTPGKIMRENFVGGGESASILYKAGNDWRSWAYSQPESEFIKDINGQRFVLLYRGEKDTYYQLKDGRQWSYIQDKPENINVYNPETGENSLFEYNSDNYINLKTGEVINFSDLDTSKSIFKPIFNESQPVYSMTSDPEVSGKGYFNSTKEFINPETGLKEHKKFILAQWVPVDDIIGPVGRNSGEHEFLVMDRKLIPDESFVNITGHSKTAPKGTKISAIIEEEIVSPTQVEPELIKKGINSNNEPLYLFEDNGKYFFGVASNPIKLTSKDAFEDLKNAVINGGKTETDIYFGKPAAKIEPQKVKKTLDFPDLESALKATGPQPVLVAPAKDASQYGVGNLYIYKEGDQWVTQSGETGLTYKFDEKPNPEEYTGAWNVYEGKPNPNKIQIESFGGYDQSGTVGLKVPRKSIITGSGDEVNYNLDDSSNWLNQDLVDDTGFQTVIKQDEDGVWHATTAKDGTSVNSTNLDNLVDSLKSSGFTVAKSKGAKLLDVVLKFAGGNKLSFAEEQPGISKSKIKLTPSEQPVNNLAANIVQPDIPTPKPANISELKPLEVKDVINGFLTTQGINKDIANQLSGLSKKERADLADQVVNQLSLHGPTEDIVRTVINSFTKAGKGDTGTLARANNILRGVWATGDGSWFGIQGLLSIPHMLLTGRGNDAIDTIVTSMRILGGNKEAFRKYVQRTLENLPSDAPNLNQAVDSGLHLSFLQGNPDIDFNIVERLSGNRLQPDLAFAAAGDISRISEFYSTWRRYKNSPDLDLNKIAKAVNRGTGIAERPFGGYIGSFALFAPRFFQSQLEIVAKSFTDGSIEGNLARRQLLSLLGTGVALTFAANQLRGYDTELDPTDPNFLRIRNIAGNDVSVFGPWDSLAKLVVHLGQGDFEYARSKFSPLATVAMNLMTGETFRGEPFPPTGNPLQASAKLAKSMLLPFAWQDIGQGGVVGQGLNFFGVKSSVLSNSEKFEQNMVNLGLDPNDPLDRRQFLADHPEQRNLVTERAIQANEVRTDIQGRQLLNEQLVSSDQISLVDFRENRKILSRELRNKMDIVNQGQEFKADTQQGRWIEGYYSLFDQAADPVTHDIVGQEFDKLEANWIAANGQGAYDYVQRYLGINKNPIEMQYLSDMHQLDQLGYFNLQKYDQSIYELSGLTDQQIDDYRDKVSAARSVNPGLAELDFQIAAYEILGDLLNDEQIYAITLAGKEQYANSSVEELKNLYPQLFLWFNPNASWSNYQTLASQLDVDSLSTVAS